MFYKINVPLKFKRKKAAIKAVLNGFIYRMYYEWHIENEGSTRKRALFFQRLGPRAKLFPIDVRGTNELPRILYGVQDI